MKRQNSVRKAKKEKPTLNDIFNGKKITNKVKCPLSTSFIQHSPAPPSHDKFGKNKK